MASLLLKAMNLAVIAGWMVLAVVLVRAVVSRLPKSARCGLWALVALRLVFPFSIESVFSLLPSPRVLPDLVLSGPSFTVESGIAAVDGRVNEYLTDRYYEGVTVPANTGEMWMERLSWVWVAGIALLAGYAIVSSLRLHWKLRTAAVLEEPVWISDEIGTPFLFGLLRPRIYLPSDLTGVQRDCVLAHEFAHLRHRDHWWKALGFALLAVYWFQPLLWLAYFLFCRDLELACDERAARGMSLEEKRCYAHALLACSTGRRLPIAPLAFGEHDVKTRVKAVLHSKKPALWVSAAAVLVCSAVALGFLTVPQAATVYDHSNVETLYSCRTQYTGNTAAIEGILAELPFPEDFEFQEFSFQDQWDPFYIDLEFKTPPQPTMYYFAREHEMVQELNKSACTLFALVHNLRQVRFVLDDGGEEPLLLSFSRENAEEVVGVDLWSESATVSQLDSLLKRIDDQVDTAAQQESSFFAEMDALVEEIAASPAYSSAPGDYIKEHQDAYDRFLSYGDNTLLYCFERFLGGGQNGLEGHLLSIACCEILEIEDSAMYATGQDWFDHFLELARNGELGRGYYILREITDRQLTL